MEAFCHFVLKNPSRISMIFAFSTSLAPQLTYEGEDGLRCETNDVLQLLAEVLTKAENLTRLRIDFLEDTLCQSPELFSALASIRTLKTMKTSDASYRTTQLLLSCSSSLEVVDLCMGGSDCEPPAMLSKFQNSLTVLHLSYHESDFGYDHGIIFPCVRSLCLRHIAWWNPTLRGLVYTFPNLHRLNWDYEEDSDEEEMEEVRERDLAMRYDGWPSLDMVLCCAQWAYALAFRSSVRYWLCNYFCPPENWHYVRAALMEIRPTHLRLTIHPVGLQSLDQLAYIFPEVGITHLHLEVQLVDGPCISSPKQYIETLLTKLGEGISVLTQLQFFSACFDFRTGDSKIVANRSAVVEIEALRLVDFVGRGLHLARHAQQMTHACFQVSSSREIIVGEYTRFIRTAMPHDNSNPTVEILTTTEGRNLLAESPVGGGDADSCFAFTRAIYT
ncbi:hypothetical protein EIP91_007688 [Steccherinum ochraceum]|uniref:F-box domain-containing protein n=1 Tax=Steccherinum ochraceum TaxID=92696 RepID=A0A4R0RE72_9APHY|nr:hypothetical protein EIP91_007688 [Steccherinum ochraceum]